MMAGPAPHGGGPGVRWEGRMPRAVTISVLAILTAGLVVPACGRGGGEVAAGVGCEPGSIAPRFQALADAPASQTALIEDVMDGCDDSAAVLAEAFRLQAQAEAEQACLQPTPQQGMSPAAAAAR